MLVAGLLMMAAPVAVWAQTSDSSAAGFFGVEADANGVGMTFGDPTSQPYPLGAALVPNAVAQLGIGPSGHALSSMAWPGPAAGNAGSLANVIGTPLPPEVVANANDPVRAEAQASGGNRQEQTVGPMSAVVDGASSEAATTLSDFAAPGIVSAARIVTRSRSFLDNGKATAVAETQLQGVEIAGVLHIDSLLTTAKGSTDGTVATTDKQVVISGVTVQGQQASIDDKGIHVAPVADQPNPLLPVVDAANQALAGMTMKAYFTQPIEEHTEGGAAVVNTGALIIDWNAGGSGQHLMAVLGGAGVNVSATPGSDFGLGGGDLEIPTPSLSAPAPSFDSSPVQAVAAPTQRLIAAPKPAPVAKKKAVAAPLATAPVSANYPDSVPLGWVVIGVIGMMLAGLGLHQLRGRALAMAAASTTCPLERGTR
jgi:hypothetical protein